MVSEAPQFLSKRSNIIPKGRHLEDAWRQINLSAGEKGIHKQHHRLAQHISDRKPHLTLSKNSVRKNLPGEAKRPDPILIEQLGYAPSARRRATTSKSTIALASFLEYQINNNFKCEEGKVRVFQLRPFSISKLTPHSVPTRLSDSNKE